MPGVAEYDAIIIGAGLAGLYCAICLDGLKLALLTNQPVGSRKPCGGLFSKRANELIEAVDVGNGHYYHPKEVVADLCFGTHLREQRFFNVNREKLEQSLYRNLDAQTPCHISTQTLIEKTKDGFLVRNRNTGAAYACEYLIAADGANSFVRKQTGHKRASTIRVEQLFINAKIDRAVLVMRPEVTPDYYYWIIPKDELTLVGYKRGDAEKVHADISANFPAIDVSKPVKRESHPLTKINGIDEILLGEGNLFFIGEAAGLVMPSSGEGITAALESAKALADVLNGGEKEKNKAYRKLMDQRIVAIERDLLRAGGTM